LLLYMSFLGWVFFFFSSRRRHTRFSRDWSSDVCSSDLGRRRRSGESAVAGAFHVKRSEERFAPTTDFGDRVWSILMSRPAAGGIDRKSTRLNSSHVKISYAVFCLKKKKK